MKPQPVVFYHGNCFDGICSAWVISKVFPDATFIPLLYGEDWRAKVFPALNYPAGLRPDVIFVDFSLKRDEMIEISQFTELLVLDHHKTAQKELEGLDFAKFDMNESGASLAWKHYFPGTPMPQVVQYVADRDLWRFNLPHSHVVNAFIQSFPMNLDTYEMLSGMLDHDLGFERAIQGGASIERYKDTMVKAICKTAAFTHGHPFYDIRVPIVNTSLLFSEVGHELCKMYPDAPFGAYYYDRLIDAKRQWGMRSIGDFDVSEVAKKLGGGGHKNAAGFEHSLHEL